LGQCLLQQAINGFLRCGMDTAALEVTAENETAVRLYLRMGFDVREVLYRCGETGKPVKPQDVVYF
jgi:ribosomal protein S18 acetylase RimI-like enzyme